MLEERYQMVIGVSSFNAERGVVAGRLDKKLFDVLDGAECGAGRQLVFECFDAFTRTFGDRLDATVGQVAHVADDLVPRRRALCKEAKADALHFPTDRKLSCGFHPVNPLEENIRRGLLKNLAILKEESTKMQSRN